jgi:hypothetical protein
MSQNPFQPFVGQIPPRGQAFNYAVDRIQQELLRRDDAPMGATDDGWVELENSTGEHMGTVGVLAVHYARRESLREFDRVHVQRAHHHLGARPRAEVAIYILTALGSLIFGAGGGLAGSVYQDGQVALDEVGPFTVAVVLAAVGLLLALAAVGVTLWTRKR